MNQKIIHRGPDQQDVYENDGITLGHVRLSIIDLSVEGKQPMINSTGELVIVFNGEIYNYRELKFELMEKGYKFNNKTDTEVIMAAYSEWGVNCLTKFNGMFAFCIYDTRYKTLFLARDRMGEKPLYYWQNEQNFMFSSEIKAILECEEVKKMLNMEAVNKYLTFRYNPDEETFFSGIHKLLPSTYILYDIKTHEITKKRYWQPLNYQNTDSIEHNSKKLFDIYKESMKDKFIGEVKMGVLLSGGIDSASIVAINKELGKNLNTYSINFGNDERNKDYHFAKKISDYFGTQHKEITVNPDVVSLLPKIAYFCDEPLGDSSLIPTYLLTKEIKKEVDVVFSGVGGDENFLGYQHHKFAKYHYLSHIIPKNSPLFAYKLFNNSIKKTIPYLSSLGLDGVKRLNTLLKMDKTSQYLEMVGIFSEQEKNELVQNKLPSLKPEYQSTLENKQNSFLKNIQMLEYNTFLVENCLMHMDKMCMANSIEGRAPLLDYKIINFSLNLPISQKIHLLNEKYIFKNAMVGHLPKEILERKKQPYFFPIDKMNNKVKDEFKQICYDKNFLKLNTNYIDKMFTNINLYKSRQIYSLASLNEWNDVFFNDEKIS